MSALVAAGPLLDWSSGKWTFPEGAARRAGLEYRVSRALSGGVARRPEPISRPAEITTPQSVRDRHDRKLLVYRTAALWLGLLEGCVKAPGDFTPLPAGFRGPLLKIPVRLVDTSRMPPINFAGSQQDREALLGMFRTAGIDFKRAITVGTDGRAQEIVTIKSPLWVRGNRPITVRFNAPDPSAPARRPAPVP